MSKRNSILDTLSEGMLTTIQSNNNTKGIFNGILKGKIQNTFSKFDTGNTGDSRSIRILKGRVIASKRVDNKTFLDMGNGYVLVVFHNLPIARGLLVSTGYTVRTLDNAISKLSLLPKDYASFVGKVDKVFRVTANVMYDTSSNKVCNTITECMGMFFRTWFKKYGSSEFKKCLIDTRLADYISITSIQVGSTYDGMDCILSLSFDILDTDKFDEIKKLSNGVDTFSCYYELDNAGTIDFYLMS
jgi:hypothetical protein